MLAIGNWICIHNRASIQLIRSQQVQVGCSHPSCMRTLQRKYANPIIIRVYCVDIWVEPSEADLPIEFPHVQVNFDAWWWCCLSLRFDFGLSLHCNLSNLQRFANDLTFCLDVSVWARESRLSRMLFGPTMQTMSAFDCCSSTTLV